MPASRSRNAGPDRAAALEQYRRRAVGLRPGTGAVRAGAAARGGLARAACRRHRARCRLRHRPEFRTVARCRGHQRAHRRHRTEPADDRQGPPARAAPRLAQCHAAVCPGGRGPHPRPGRRGAAALHPRRDAERRRARPRAAPSEAGRDPGRIGPEVGAALGRAGEPVRLARGAALGQFACRAAQAVAATGPQGRRTRAADDAGRRVSTWRAPACRPSPEHGGLQQQFDQVRPVAGQAALQLPGKGLAGPPPGPASTPWPRANAHQSSTGRSSVSMSVARCPGAPAPTLANSPRRIW